MTRNRQRPPVLRLLAAAGTVVILSLAEPAGAQDGPGDPEAGGEFARKVCATCHVVTADWPANPRSAAPAFVEIAQEPSVTALSLRVFLRSPHRRMPNLILSEKETDDVIAYILALRGER